MALKNLIYFAEYNKTAVEEMCKHENDFIFAVCSINVTFYLKKYLHLADFLEFDKDQQDLCSRRALKSFCRMMMQDEFAF
jgi:hypothetical protein